MGGDGTRSGRRRRATAAALGAGLLAAAWPAGAQAHGLAARADLPIPQWLFAWAAAAVLVVSFAGLAVGWPRPRLQAPGWRPLPGGLGGLAGSRPVEVLGGLLGTLALGATVALGLLGPDGATDNVVPTFVMVVVWVGLALASPLLGDVFRWLSPWRAVGRTVGAATRGRRGGRASRPYPERLGQWPAAAGLLAFTWIELASGWSDQGDRLAVAALAYSAVTWAGMARYGTEAWNDRAEFLGVYLGLFARLSPWETRERVLGLRPPLGGLPRLPVGPGTVGVLCAMIGTVTFDGASQGALWRDGADAATRALAEAGAGDALAGQLAATVGLLGCVGLVAALYAMAMDGARSAGGGRDARTLRRAFAHTLVPIALAYAAAHYLTYLLFQGQAMGYLVSDPIGRGWDLLGTAGRGIDYGVIGQEATWYAQVAFVALGHVAGLVLAHDRALALYDDARTAVRSQYWALGAMVAFTSLALWLLAQANA